MNTDRPISATTQLRDCPEGNVGLALVRPISDRLDELVTLTEKSGDRTSRKELIAALILAAPPDGHSLAKVLKQYRLASAGDSRLGDVSQGEIRAASPMRPGPRPRRNH